VRLACGLATSRVTRKGVFAVTKTISVLIMAAVVPLVVGGMYVASPLFSSSRAKLAAETDERSEAVRRMLDKYAGNERLLADLLADLERLGVDVALDDARITAILEEDRSILEDAGEELRERTGGAEASRRRELEDRYKLAGGATDAAMVTPGGFGNNVSQMTRTIRQAVKSRSALLAENKKLLSQALGQIESALSESRGDASGRDHLNAQRMKGLVLLAQASEHRRQAERMRRVVHAQRETLVDAIVLVNRLVAEQELLEASGVHDRIDALNQDVDASREAVAAAETELKSLEATIADLVTRIDAYRDSARRARDEMDALEDAGVDLLDPSGFETFADAYARASSEYRKATSQAHRLERGTLEDARIDDSGDYVLGQYVPADAAGSIEPRRGLIDYRDDYELASADLAGLRETLASLERSVADLEVLAEHFETRTAEAAEQESEIRSQAPELYKPFAERAGAADESFGRAIAKAKSAAQAFRAASGVADTRVRDARDRLSEASQTAQENSAAKARSEDRWLGGQCKNEIGQARLLLGSLWTQRFQAAALDHDLVARAIEALDLPEVDAALFAQRRDEARESARTTLRAAVSDLERSGRELNNWTVAAEVGGAHYLLSIVEGDVHVGTAIGNYENAVQGREDLPAAQPIVRRLAKLRTR
jgi:hypothetical protein